MKFDRAIKIIPQILHELTGLSGEISEIESREHKKIPIQNPDLISKNPHLSFIIEYKSKSSAETIGAAIRTLKDYLPGSYKGKIPLIVVPYMGDVGKGMCKEAKISWMDLSGNAMIQAPSIFVNILGRPNQYSILGRPSNLFAPRSARISRLMLLNPARSWTYQELVERTKLSKGYVSKVVKRLLDASMIKKMKGGLLTPNNPNLLLEAWSESYNFNDHLIRKGHLADRSIDKLLFKLVKSLKNHISNIAITGLPAACTETAAHLGRLPWAQASVLQPHRIPDLG